MTELVVRWKNGESAIYRFTTKGDAVAAKMIFENHCKDEIKEIKINVFEPQPTDDCISREDTLKEFKRVYFDNATVIRCAELILGSMPSVTRERPKEDGVEDFIKHKIDYLEELASIETNEGRWREEEKYLYAISVLEEVVEYMNTSGGKENV